ncbi:V2 [Jatropha mosaic Nigeria virus]|uniref:Protein V2 n=1 Tax=Jatropha mosaic Nigeria virus TaxID=1213406 RepID=I7A6Q6_9GEMI|nr:V2 [Jatropha mosaic Nigeria virus]AFO38432.1 V2 [Jatropha mosaic Nigeria virus]
MWDPLRNEFPETLHGFRCMLAVKFLQALVDSYSPDTKGYEYIRDLICILRSRHYNEANIRYGLLVSRIQCTPASQLRESSGVTCSCEHCPRHFKKTGLEKQAHEQEAQVLPDV